MFYRVLFSVLILLALSTLPVAAQEDSPSWCPLAESDAPASNTVRAAYVEAGNLYLADDDNEPILLVETGDVDRVNLADDGTVIAYTRKIDLLWSELWAINSDGSEMRLLIGAEQFAAMRTEDFADAIGLHRFDWILDTHILAFNSSVVVEPGSGIYEHIADDLWTINVDTSELTPLLAVGEGGEFTYSPDGSRVVIQQLHRLDVMNADGSDRRTNILDSYSTVGVGHGSLYPQILWQDSQTFLTAVAMSADPMSQSDGIVSVFRVVLDGSTAETLGSFTAFFPSFQISPDSAKVAFWRTISTGSNTRQLMIATVDGAEEYLYLEADLLEFSGWLPDSGHFLFRSAWDQPVQVGDICGGAAPFAEITDFMVTPVQWIDAQHYVFLVVEGGENRVYYAGALGDTQNRLDGVSAIDMVSIG